MMDWNEAHEAFEDARNAIWRGDRIVAQLSAMLPGRLRSGDIAASTLKKLKHELKNYDASTGKWKGEE